MDSCSLRGPVRPAGGAAAAALGPRPGGPGGHLRGQTAEARRDIRTPGLRSIPPEVGQTVELRL